MRTIHVGLFLLLFMMVAACSGQEEVAETTAASAETTTEAPTSTSTSSTTTTSLMTTTEATLPPTTSTTINTNPVSSDAVVGAWSFEAAQAEVFMVLNGDGSYQVSFILDSDAPLDFGEYTFDGSVLVLHSNEEVTFNGCGGTSASYVTAFSADEQTFTLPPSSAEDECTRRLRDLTQAEFTRVATE